MQTNQPVANLSPPIEIEGSFDEYRFRGNYHQTGTMARSWIPFYHRRFTTARAYFSSILSSDANVLDVGCGEGDFLKQLKQDGFTNLRGVEPFATVTMPEISRGSIYEIAHSDESFDAISCFDVLEHLPLNRQSDAAAELYRVCKKGGILLITVPNMAHLQSRLQFLMRGRPWRNSLKKHPGELTIHERLDVLCDAGFHFVASAGFHLTLSRNPRPSIPFGKLVSKLMFHPKAPASLCAEVMLILGRSPIHPAAKDGGFGALREAAASYVPVADDPTAY